MLIIISSAKTIEIKKKKYINLKTIPEFKSETNSLLKLLKEYNVSMLGKLMKISPKLADYNFSIIQNRQKSYNESNSLQAALAYNGEVFKSAGFDSFSEKDFEFANDRLRIISGLHGILRPCDLIQPYRLEMSTRLENENGNDLYKFWGDKIAVRLNKDIKNQEDNILINLASNEYSKPVLTDKLNAKVINIIFKERRDDDFVIISFNAKKARGLMTNFILKNRLQNPEQIKMFEKDNYFFNENMSSETDFVFTR